MLSDKYDYSTSEITRIQLVANTGATLGGKAMVACIVDTILIYRYCFTSLPRLYALAFFKQFCVQGAFGIFPVHLVEVSSPAFSALVVGTSYNLGVLIALPAPYVETKGERIYPFHR
jgi:SHS family lactate transporter-like MFS transporter